MQIDIRSNNIKIMGINTNKHLINFIGFLLISWTIAEFYVLPESNYLRPYCKTAVWIIPVYLYIKFIELKHPIQYVKLKGEIGKPTWVLVLILIS